MLQDPEAFKHVTVAILAGGLGTRLRPVIAERPKALAEIHGRPFLAYLLDQLSTTGFRSVVICTGYCGEQIHGALGDSYGSLRLSYSREARPLGTGGALRLALPNMISDPVLVMNGDSFCAADLKGFWDWHCRRGSRATILLTQVLDTQRYGAVKVDADGAVIEFAEKSKGKVAGWINAGIYLLSRQVLHSIAEDTNTSLEYDVFPRWVGQGLYGHLGQGRFLDIGTPDDYAAAQAFFTPAS